MSEQTLNHTLPFNHSGFYAYLAKHQLMASRCSGCGAVYLPPRALCPHCYSQQMEWTVLSGEGTLEGFTTIAVGLPVMITEGYNRENPYCCGIVRLAEGPAISGQLVGIDCTHPEAIPVGAPVQAVYIERGEGENHRVYLGFTLK